MFPTNIFYLYMLDIAIKHLRILVGGALDTRVNFHNNLRSQIIGRYLFQ